ncbi:hypothetical protein ANTPLA_LOCUS639 [Anthophora plagiata]
MSPILDFPSSKEAFKSSVYNQVLTTKEDMKERIRNTCCTMNRGNAIRNAIESLTYRVQTCFTAAGQHFEYIIK